MAQCWCPQGRRLLCPCGCLWLTFFQFSSVPRWRSAAPGEAIFARGRLHFSAPIPPGLQVRSPEVRLGGVGLLNR
jgi:hypothetical protein